MTPFVALMSPVGQSEKQQAATYGVAACCFSDGNENR